MGHIILCPNVANGYTADNNSINPRVLEAISKILFICGKSAGFLVNYEQYKGDGTYRCSMDTDRGADSISQAQAGGRGRPVREPREALNRILWVSRTGAPWKEIPSRYHPYQTCHRWFQKWTRQGVFGRILKEPAEGLYERGGMDIRKTFIDGPFTPAKKGGVLWAIRNAGKGPGS